MAKINYAFLVAVLVEFGIATEAPVTRHEFEAIVDGLGMPSFDTLVKHDVLYKCSAERYIIYHDGKVVIDEDGLPLTTYRFGYMVNRW